MEELTHTTWTKWKVTYSPSTREGTARWHTAPEGSSVPFTVSGTAAGPLVTFRTTDKVPHDTISAVQRWIESLS